MEVRQALNYATPKEQILEAVLFGNATVANSNIPPVKYWDEAVEPYPFDLAKAEQLMAKSSVPDGFDLDLTIPSGDPVEKQTAEIIKAEWAKIGVNVNIVQQEFGTMFANWLEGKGGMAATFPGDALSSDTLSDDEIAAIVYDPAAGLDSLGTGYENKKVIDLLGKAKGTLDEEVRADALRRGAEHRARRRTGGAAVLHQIGDRRPGLGQGLPDLPDRLVAAAGSLGASRTERRGNRGPSGPGRCRRT